MSQLPAMPMWWADFFSKTDHLSNEEQWAYAKLLAKTWLRNGRPFPDEPRDLARLLNMGVKRWIKIRERLAPFFDLSEGTWRQQRLENEFREVNRRREISRSNGSLGGRPQSVINNGIENPAGSSQANLDETTHTYIKKEEERDSWLPPLIPVESESQTPRKPSRRKIVEVDLAFDQMWACYPRKEDKGHARISYRSARKKTDAATIQAGVERYCEQSRGTERRFIALPATWLNGERWADEEVKNVNGTATAVPLHRSREDLERESEMRQLFRGVFEGSNTAE